MSDTTKRLVETYKSYLIARQARYDELVVMYSGTGHAPHPEDPFDCHKMIVNILNDEQMGIMEILND